MGITAGAGIRHQKRSLKNIIIGSLALMVGAVDVYFLLTRHTSLSKLVMVGISAGFIIVVVGVYKALSGKNK